MVSLLEASVLLLCITISGLHVLQPVLDSLLAISPRNPIVSATFGAVALLALLMTYFTGIILVYLQVAPAPPALVSPAALRLLAVAGADMACALLLLSIMPLVVPWL